ncbi:MAG: hypothetical protein K6G01_08400 [Eubacterium sp.]|nr:hypothetical protein [Eubacterium sp.]
MKKLVALALSMGLAFSLPLALGATEIDDLTEDTDITEDTDTTEDEDAATQDSTVDASPDEGYDGDEEEEGEDEYSQGDEEEEGGEESDENLIVIVKGNFSYEDGTPAKGLTVKLHSKTQKTSTNKKGNYKFDNEVATGSHTLTVSKGDANYATVKLDIEEDGVDIVESSVAEDVFTTNKESSITKNGNTTKIVVVVDGVITADMIENATDESTSPKTSDSTKAAGAAFVVVVAGVALFFTGRRYKKA